MRVAPHPHIGLQTVTFLSSGEVLHRDGLGSAELVRPGELSIMTAGEGIAHAEESPPGHGPLLQGVQLWIALAEDERRGAPDFALHRELPEVGLGAFSCRILCGEFAGERSPAAVRASTLAVELAAPSSARAAFPLEAGRDYGPWSLAGRVCADGMDLARGTLATVAMPGARDRGELMIESEGPCRALLIAGMPLGEPLLMWWNFVARTAREIEAARARWEGGGFAPVVGYAGAPIPAPQLPAGRLRARP